MAYTWGDDEVTTTPMTDQLSNRLSHLIPDVQPNPRDTDHGRFQALCGHVIVAAPMVAEEGPPCPACSAQFLLAGSKTQPHQQAPPALDRAQGSRLRRRWGTR